MKLTKQIFLILFLLLSLTLIFSACDKDDSETAITSKEETTTAPGEEQTTAHTHTFGAWIIDQAATCTEAGSQHRVCTGCGESEAEVIPANGHTEVIDKAIAPTCTESGLTEGKHCSVCNAVLVAQQTVPANGHSFGTWIIDSEPTCTETGSKHRVCSVCNEGEIKAISANGHTEAVDKAITPTCTETGLTEGKHCSVCNAVLVAQQIVPANGHTEVIDKAVAPTCTESGLTEGKHCSVCNAVLVAQQIVPANGHTEVIDKAVEPTCTETGLAEGKHCSVCNAVLVAQHTVPANGHQYLSGICTVCNAIQPPSEGLMFTSNGDGTCSVSERGTCTDTSIVIPVKSPNGDSVTSIEAYAFSSYDDVTSIMIPDSITSIGDGAFSGCRKLKSIAIPESVTSIGSGAFHNCSSLTSISIPFVGAKTGVTANDTYQYPFGYIFGKNSYAGGRATQQYYYGRDTSSPTYATYYIPTSLKSVTVTGGNILYGAFYNCSCLTNITIGNGVTKIESSAFSGCSGLTSITIPFVGAKSKVTANDTYQYPFGYIFGTDSYNNSTAVTQNYYGYNSSIYSNTFYIPTSLKSVTVTGGNILRGAFHNCSKLTSITIPDSVTSIEKCAFYNCSKLASITIPDNVTSIGDLAFKGCTALTNITIPDNVTSIGNFAFSGCSGLTSITIPDSVTSIGDSTFFGCAGLTSITIPDSVTSIGNSAFSNCSKLASITIPDSVTSIGESAFKDCSGLTSVTIPNSVACIGNSAFSGCSVLTSITIPDSVTSIGRGAFFYCSDLANITIPVSVTSIGDAAFQSCSDLISIIYQGTKAQWNAIGKGTNWNDKTGNYTIYCTNGNIAK